MSIRIAAGGKLDDSGDTILEKSLNQLSTLDYNVRRSKEEADYKLASELQKQGIQGGLKRARDVHDAVDLDGDQVMDDEFQQMDDEDSPHPWQVKGAGKARKGKGKQAEVSTKEGTPTPPASPGALGPPATVPPDHRVTSTPTQETSGRTEGQTSLATGTPGAASGQEPGHAQAAEAPEEASNRRGDDSQYT